MNSTTSNTTFLQALGIGCNDIVCLVGAGGKTSLMFHLAGEARQQGLSVMVTTTTRILVPSAEHYDSIDLGNSPDSVSQPGIHIRGQLTQDKKKIESLRPDILAWQMKQFDLVLIEADGAAGKPLKGWNSTEPVIAENTSKTIGLLDIQTIGQIIDSTLVHRLDMFTELTGGRAGERTLLGHLLRLVTHTNGLFGQARGEEVLFINKVESRSDQQNAATLRQQLENLKIVAGSVNEGTLHGLD